MDITSAYHLLEVPSTAPLNEAEAAYRDLSHIWHPDRHRNGPLRVREKAEGKMRDLNIAIGTIREVRKRAPVAAPPPEPTRTATATPPPTEPSHTKDWAEPFCVKGKWGFRDLRTRRIILTPRYTSVELYCDGLARVETGGFWKSGAIGFVDTCGIERIPPKFQEAKSFSEGLAAVKLAGGMVGYIDTNGRFAIPPYDPGSATVCDKPSIRVGESFSEGLAAVLIWRYKSPAHFDKWGYINPAGDVVIEPQFEIAHPFREGWADVYVDKTWYRVDKSGNLFLRD